MNNQVQVSTLKDFNQLLTNPSTQNYLREILGEKKSQFVNNLTALVANSKTLQACEPITLMYAGIKATALDLPLDANLGLAYVIPFKNNREGKTEAQFQIGYKGFVQLAIRSGQFSTINVTDVREGEIEYEDILTGEIRIKGKRDRLNREVVGYCAYFRLVNGFSKMLYMSKEEVEAHAKRYSQTYSSRYDNTRNSSKWSTDFDAMAKKTALKLLLSKWAPLSVDMAEATKADQSVVRENGYDYVDNQCEVVSTDLEQMRKEAEEEAETIVVEEVSEAPGANGTLFSEPQEAKSRKSVTKKF